VKPAGLLLALTTIVFLALQHAASAWPIKRDEIAYQKKCYKKWFKTELETRFDKLPTNGMVPRWRHPYAGHIYPDTAGGTARVLRKYDQAFHRGRPLAVRYERGDVARQQQTYYRTVGGWFGYSTYAFRGTPHWAGHCNGWAGAAIRHAEPQKSVVRNGVTFTPADIKGLLAELYVYCDTEFLGGVDRAVNPATFHLTMTNWIGRQKHPIAADFTLGKEVWNYPIYAYRTAFAKRGERQVEVRMNIGYVYLLNGEPDRAPKNYRFRSFRYLLDLNEQGEIVGGSYLYGSSRFDMLWTQLRPTPGGEKGNEAGNPYLDVDTVMSLWRESADEPLRGRWYTIDMLPEDKQFREDYQLAAEKDREEARREAMRSAQTIREWFSEPTASD